MKWVEHVASFAGRQGQAPAGLRRRQARCTCSTPPATKLKALDPSLDRHRPRLRRHAASASPPRTTTAPRCGSWPPRPTARACWSGRAATPAIAISPDGDAVVTAMQENALHGWRLSDGQHMRMSGYPAKTEALSFTRNGKWLASSGRGRDGALAVLRRRPDGQGADRTRRRRRHHLHDASPAIRSRRWWPPGSPTGWWCWPTSTSSAHPAGRAARARAGLGAGVERRTARGWRSGPRPVSPPWWISRAVDRPIFQGSTFPDPGDVAWPSDPSRVKFRT